jgi:hypothetical protein
MYAYPGLYVVPMLHFQLHHSLSGELAMHLKVSSKAALASSVYCSSTYSMHTDPQADASF